MDPSQGFIAEFRGFVEELVSPEKRNIVALTEIAREALQMQAQAVPGLATVIIDRIVEAPQQLKLPAFYLLDSISKLVGEPYKAYFGVHLPRAFGAAWAAGTSRPALLKLLATWQGVFPERVLEAVRAEIEAPLAPRYDPLPAPNFPAAAAEPQPALYGVRYSEPAVYPHHADPAAYSRQHSLYGAHEPGAGYARDRTGYDQGRAGLAPREGTPPNAAQRPAAAKARKTPPPGMTYPVPAEPRPAVASALPLPDLLSSLLAAGVLGNPAAAASGPAAARPAQDADAGPSPIFSPDAIKKENPAAVRRLLERTQATKSSFLDLQFLRRARRSGAQLRASRLWYVDVDTWLASARGADAAAPAATGEATAGAPALDPLVERYGPSPSVRVDEDQPNCALSGEAFDQVWDEDRQEWRFAGAVVLEGDDAARHGVPDGSIVLVSALGSGAGVGKAEPDAGSALDGTIKEEEGDLKPSEIKLEAEEEEVQASPKRIKLE